MNCQHCNEPNPEGYFYCRNCEQRASAPKFTVNTIMRDTPMATAIRKDQINFGCLESRYFLRADLHFQLQSS